MKASPPKYNAPPGSDFLGQRTCQVCKKRRSVTQFVGASGRCTQCCMRHPGQITASGGKGRFKTSLGRQDSPWSIARGAAAKASADDETVSYK
jgi:hypothetical protein